MRRAEHTATALSALGAQTRVLDGPTATAVLTAAVDPYQYGDASWPRAVAHLPVTATGHPREPPTTTTTTTGPAAAPASGGRRPRTPPPPAAEGTPPPPPPPRPRPRWARPASRSPPGTCASATVSPPPWPSPATRPSSAWPGSTSCCPGPAASTWCSTSTRYR